MATQCQTKLLELSSKEVSKVEVTTARPLTLHQGKGSLLKEFNIFRLLKM